ncbi:MAG: ATP-binding protein [Endomicrobium sp.]|jgi:predicted AAA+ superfamily ATPase|nr:ATP-binding protein [Endomicrobium sp.]
MQKSVLEAVVESQTEKVKKRGLGLQRDVLPALPDLSSHALIISGIRRCGKSTLLLQLLKNKKKKHFYLNFDDPRLINFEVSDFQIVDQIIKERKAQLLFLDEPQIINGWEIYVKQKLDEKYKIFVTGSNASLLSRELGTRLTGRHVTKELFPFSYAEFIKFKHLKIGADSLKAYIEIGGFPEYVKTLNSEIITTLFNDILDRDIIIRHSIRDFHSLKRLAQYLVSNVGNLVTARKLEQALNIKTLAILEYFSFFEDAYLVNFLPKFSCSFKAQLINPKKVYAVDTGLINNVSASLTGDYGRLLENIIYWHLRRENKEIYYFSESGRECDFTVCQNGNPTEILQVCYDLNHDNRDREITGLKAAMDFFKISNAKIITYNQDDAYIQDGKKISIIPAWKYMTQK